MASFARALVHCYCYYYYYHYHYTCALKFAQAAVLLRTPVSDLFAKGRPPAAIRTRFYLYNYSSAASLFSNGHWWHRQGTSTYFLPLPVASPNLLSLLAPPLSSRLPAPSLSPAPLALMRSIRYCLVFCMSTAAAAAAAAWRCCAASVLLSRCRICSSAPSITVQFLLAIRTAVDCC